MPSTSTFLGILTTILALAPAGGPFYPFLQTLLQIVNFISQYQPPA